MREGFVRPDFAAPLDVEAELRKVPPGATIKGMFLAEMVDAMARRGIALAGARERYVAFKGYPLNEHVQMLLACARAMHPHLPEREGLRRIGWFAHHALTRSIIGKVIVEMRGNATEMFDVACKAYALSLSLGRADVIERGDETAIVRLSNVFAFADSHHVGVFEGFMRRCELEGEIFIKPTAANVLDLLIEWQPSTKMTKPPSP